MKSLSLIITLCMSAAYAGVIPWTKDGEDEALSLWREYCSGQSDGGVDSLRDIDWYCKRSPDGGRQLTYPHKIDLGRKIESKKQVVFIETPADNYKHDITISGNLGASLKTNIIVIPGKDTHSVDVKKEITVNQSGDKPAIFFIRNNPIENGDLNPGYSVDNTAQASTVHEATAPEKVVTSRRAETRVVKEKEYVEKNHN